MACDSPLLSRLGSNSIYPSLQTGFPEVLRPKSAQHDSNGQSFWVSSVEAAERATALQGGCHVMTISTGAAVVVVWVVVTETTESVVVAGLQSWS